MIGTRSRIDPALEQERLGQRVEYWLGYEAPWEQDDASRALITLLTDMSFAVDTYGYALDQDIMQVRDLAGALKTYCTMYMSDTDPQKRLRVSWRIWQVLQRSKTLGEREILSNFRG